MSATMLTVAFSPWLLAQGRVPMAEGIWKKLDPSGKPEAEFRIILAAEKITLWDSWLRRDSLKAFGRAFGKPSSLFIANWPVLRRPVETAGEDQTCRTSVCEPKKVNS
jgi:hypothetical protein